MTLAPRHDRIAFASIHALCGGASAVCLAGIGRKLLRSGAGNCIVIGEHVDRRVVIAKAY
jgi:hypothetical protein